MKERQTDRESGREGGREERQTERERESGNGKARGNREYEKEEERRERGKRERNLNCVLGAVARGKRTDADGRTPFRMPPPTSTEGRKEGRVATKKGGVFLSSVGGTMNSESCSDSNVAPVEA